MDETYHIMKANRMYSGSGYSGPTCEDAGVPPGKTYETKADAVRDANRMAELNPVGFYVITTDGGKIVYETA